MKIIFSDFDGTLLQKRETEINKNIKKSIYSVLDNGDVFAVSSGRTYVELKHFFKEFENDIYFIANDGSLVVYREKTLYHLPVEKEIFKDFKSFTAHGKYVTYIKTPNSILIRKVMKEYRNHVMQIDSITDINEPIYKVSDYDKTVMCPLPVVYTNPDMNEYISEHANKGNASEFLINELKIKRENSYAFGDNINDLEMFDACATSYAVANALPKVKKHATKITNNIEHEFLKISHGRNRIWNFSTLKKYPKAQELTF